MEDFSNTTARPAQAPQLDHVVRSRRYLLIFDADRSHVIDLPTTATLLLGRSPDAAIRIADSSVSRQHALLAVTAEGMAVTDLRSRNGTQVDGQSISTPTPIRPGSTLLLGSVRMIVGDALATPELGAMTHAEFEARALEKMQTAKAQKAALAYCMIRVRGATGARVVATVQRTFGGAALVATYGTDVYEALLSMPSSGDVQSLVGELASALASENPASTVGGAAYPRDATSLDELIALARDGIQRPHDANPRALVAIEPAMKAVLDLASRVAVGRIPVLIVGETGSGKELLAERIHQQSPRAARPYVRVNCAALPEQLLEAELFGHEKGAFTGATQAKPGLFEMAEGGTLLLDEVGELPLSQQAKLLRVLEDGHIRRVGSVKDRRVDVRIVAATNRDLEQACARGEFRSDLYFRLGGAQLVVPPLRARRGEIAPLARHFLTDLRDERGSLELSAEAEKLLVGYPWPGNVRELRNAIERAVLLANGSVVLPDHLPERVRFTSGAAAMGKVLGPENEWTDATAVGIPAPFAKRPPPAGSDEAGVRTFGEVKQEMREVERARIIEVLEACGWNQTRAAEKLGVSRRTLVTKIAAYAIPRRKDQ